MSPETVEHQLCSLLVITVSELISYTHVHYTQSVTNTRLTLRAHCELFRQTVSKTVLETILRTILGCVHTANSVNEIEQLKGVCCTFVHVLQFSKDGVSESGGIACVCNIEITSWSG